MAVTPKKFKSLDKNGGTARLRIRTVHYIKINKNNRKGSAAALGGHLHDHLGKKEGDFSIVFETKVNGVKRELTVGSGDVVFQTGDSDRWQALTVKGFRKRFPDAAV